MGHARMMGVVGEAMVGERGRAVFVREWEGRLRQGSAWLLSLPVDSAYCEGEWGRVG